MANEVTIPAFNKSLKGEEKKICAALTKLIDKGLPKAESKIWHRQPVWFLDENPIVGFAVRKAGVQLLFWSGQSFDEPDLEPEGSFRAAHAFYIEESQIKPTQIARWLRKAKKIQWDYKNIVKRKGVLIKIGEW